MSESLESHKTPLTIMLDYSSAFDCVHHGRLLEKLRCAGIVGTALNILGSYLENRTQQPCCGDGASSDPTKVTYGVPQGGSLSALLFSLYINDLLTQCKDDMKVLGYADDVCLMFSFERPIDWTRVESSVRNMFEWSRQNGLLFNSKKSNYMVFGQRNAPTRPSG